MPQSPGSVEPVYFDSALVAKFYLNEAGRDAVRQLAARAGAVVTSGIAVAEVSAAFHRKYREGAVTPAVFRALQGQFEHDLEAGLWTCIGPTEALLAGVRDLFASVERSVYLRSLDALHLVTATSEQFRCVYTNDQHLLRACGHVGLQGIDPT